MSCELKCALPLLLIIIVSIEFIPNSEFIIKTNLPTFMKNKAIWLLPFLLNVTYIHAQIKTTKINSKNSEHYITTVINYPITGLYATQKNAEPITILYADGTGMLQNEDLVKEPILWGIECSESGIPILKEGFDSASYSFWHKKKG